MSYAAKAKTQQFTRRKPNLMKKADQLARLCHADVALIIRRNGMYYTYRSTDHDRWPPTPLSSPVGSGRIHASILVAFHTGVSLAATPVDSYAKGEFVKRLFQAI